jgi:hypothetical protein
MPAPSQQRAAAEATLHLPFTIPAKEWFTPAEAARLLGLSERFIEKLYDEGTQLAGHSHNGGDGLRMTKRIPRVWLVAYAVKTATYDDASLADALITCLPRLSPATLLKLADAARKAATR